MKAAETKPNFVFSILHFLFCIECIVMTVMQSRK